MFSPIFLITTGIVFILGSVIGSFLNVLVLRTLNEESWVKGRSRCDKCRKQIAWYDNIPLVSFLILHGKCRYCHKAIDPIHPVVELLTACLFVWWFWGGWSFFKLTQQPFTILQPLFWLIVGVILIVIFVVDLKYLIIPDQSLIILFILTVLYRITLIVFNVMQIEDLIAALIGMIGLVFFFYCLWFFTKGKGFGFGDVKLAAPLALLLGWPKILVGVFLSFILGAFVGIILVVNKKKKFGQVIPFGPFLVVGTVIALLWGDQLWQWYLSLL